MIEREILYSLRKAGFIDSMLQPHHPAWPPFVAAMATFQYGAAECMSAWMWFKDGWDAARKS